MNTALPSFHPIEPFVAAIPVDWPTVVSEAAIYRRQDYRPADCWRFALDRDYARRMRLAQPAYEASMDPLERERRQLEAQMALLRGRFVSREERIEIARKMRAYSERIDEIEQIQAFKVAAE